ncbi:glycosyltransferase family 2 protein [Agromyces bauzanensis]|uniref:Glycosyl transferase n=1 Tax=Agromyces bauzanensis TaxID=1308924 RepID=A0A917UP66_9MICO|nr:glycosyltransferase family 2 protein [Agromyces bauzanensis]GGJ71319.1 glycosyl transferase [Agromyces bauzanensis]
MNEPASDSLSTPRLAIIVVAYRSDTELDAFLASAGKGSSEPAVLIVADNLPSEGVAATIAARYGAAYVPMHANLGYGGAVNAAVELLPTTIKWVLVSNPDVMISAGAIDELLRLAGGDPAIASAGPRILNEDGSVYPSARAVPSIGSGIGHALFSRVWAGNPWTARYHNGEDYSRVRDAGWLSGACVLLRRSAFDAIGGFDPGYFMYFEDVDLGYRLGRVGYRNMFDPAASVTHLGGRSTATESAAMLRAHHRSAERFLAKRYDGVLRWPLRFALLIGLRTRLFVAERRLSH